MPQVTISIAAGGDDGRQRRTGAAYPPTGTGSPVMTETDVWIDKTFTSSYSTNNGFVRFDTSVIPDTAIVTSAVLRMEANSMVNPDTRDLNIEWYPGATWASAGTISDSDFADVVGTGANVTALSSIVNGANNDFTLSDPDANISKTGFTGIRMGISGGAPTGTNEVYFRAFEHTTQPESKLIVTYDPFQGSASVAWITA